MARKRRGYCRWLAKECRCALSGLYLLHLSYEAINARAGHVVPFLVRIEEYVYLVPFDEQEEQVALKTIIPSRRAARKYLGQVPRGKEPQ